MKLDKTVRIGTIRCGKLKRSIFAKIETKDGELSITGVIGPLASGNAYGSCGQIIAGFKEYDSRGYQSILDIDPAPRWNRTSIKRFFDVWDRWHLNGMKAGSAAQEAYLRSHPVIAHYPESHYEKASAELAAVGLNPDSDGYHYSSAWKREELPAEVLSFLRDLPDADKRAAWRDYQVPGVACCA